MPKIVLYLIIFVLVGVIGYLVFGLPNILISTTDEAVSTSTISVGEPEMVRSEPTDEAEFEPARTPTETTLAVSGSLVRFIEIENDNGVLTVYALIDDSTEIIRVDMHRVVTPGVSSPQDQLGLTLGQRVTVRGRLENGVLVATDIE